MNHFYLIPYGQNRDIREFMAAILSLCQVLDENLIKWRHFVKNTTRVEIRVTISTATRIKNNWNFGP